VPIPVLIVGPLAYDDVQTPAGRRAGILGGSAGYASIAAAKYAPTGLVSIAGRDLDAGDLLRLEQAGVDVRGVELRDGRTLRWAGIYSHGFSQSDVRNTALGVVAAWRPCIPVAFREAERVFLANTDPRAQREALDQLGPTVVVVDTMAQWIREPAAGLDLIIGRATVLSVNAEELALITGAERTADGAAMLLARGPRAVIVKRGVLGAKLFTPGATIAVPAHPATVVDPTGAGDAFAGAFLGRLAELRDAGDAAMRDAFTHGAAAASVTVEAFGLDAIVGVRRAELDRRAAWLDARAGTGQAAGLYEGR
jgi:sugar/nucleoside kinase (ribokinase family)